MKVYMQGWAKKPHTVFIAILVYSQPILIIFGTYTLYEICN